MEDKKNRFNAEYLRAILDTLEGVSIRGIARRIDVSHNTVRHWLRGGVPSDEHLSKLVSVLDELDVDVDPDLFKSDPFDLLYSEALTAPPAEAWGIL